MIDRLRFCIDNTDSPKLLEILSKIASLPKKQQEGVLDLVEAGVFTK